MSEPDMATQIAVGQAWHHRRGQTRIVQRIDRNRDGSIYAVACAEVDRHGIHTHSPMPMLWQFLRWARNAEVRS